MVLATACSLVEGPNDYKRSTAVVTFAVFDILTVKYTTSIWRNAGVTWMPSTNFEQPEWNKSQWPYLAPTVLITFHLSLNNGYSSEFGIAAGY